MPWIAHNELLRLLLLPLVRWRMRSLVVGAGLRAYGLPMIQKHRHSRMQIGQRASLRSTLASNPLVPLHPVMLSTRRAGAVLQVGDDFGMTGGSIVAAERISIGDRVLIGANCTITDFDFHPLDAQQRLLDPASGATAPVVIEHDVFIGMGSIVLKGVTLGARCVIGAGSVVTRSIPPDTVAAGNPARVVRSLADVP